jgi:hypothetical protein
MTHFLYPAVERALVFDFPALRLSLNRAEDQVERSIGIEHDGSCELHRLQSSGTCQIARRMVTRGRERRHRCAARSDLRLKGTAGWPRYTETASRKVACARRHSHAGERKGKIYARW